MTFRRTVHHRSSFNLGKSQDPVSTSQHPMSVSTSSLTFNNARMFSDLSIPLRLPAVSEPQTNGLGINCVI